MQALNNVVLVGCLIQKKCTRVRRNDDATPYNAGIQKFTL
jgi:hypothetical protein